MKCGVRRFFCLDSNYRIIPHSMRSVQRSTSPYQPRHFRLEMHFTAATNNRVAHGFDDLWQSVGAYMRMGISQNGCRSTMLAKHTQNLLDRAALLRAGVELAVAVGTGSAFTKTIVALAVHLLCASYLCQILFTLVNVLSTLQYYRTQAQLN